MQTPRAIVAAALFLIGCASTPPPAASSDGAGADTAPPTRYANVHGLKMYFEKRGTSGPALVVLHGGTGTVDAWPEALEYFAKDYQVIAPEQMGHGHTADDPKRAFDYHAMAEDTVELLKQQH